MNFNIIMEKQCFYYCSHYCVAENKNFLCRHSFLDITVLSKIILLHILLFHCNVQSHDKRNWNKEMSSIIWNCLLLCLTGEDYNHPVHSHGQIRVALVYSITMKISRTLKKLKQIQISLNRCISQLLFALQISS